MIKKDIFSGDVKEQLKASAKDKIYRFVMADGMNKWVPVKHFHRVFRPGKGLDVEANVFGEVRGYLKTPRIEVENPEAINGLAKLFGAGILTVTQEAILVEFLCHCSKVAMTGYLKSSPSAARNDLLKNSPFPLVIHGYHFNSAYQFAREELLPLAD